MNQRKVVSLTEKKSASLIRCVLLAMEVLMTLVFFCVHSHILCCQLFISEAGSLVFKFNFEEILRALSSALSPVERTSTLYSGV